MSTPVSEVTIRRQRLTTTVRKKAAKRRRKIGKAPVRSAFRKLPASTRAKLSRARSKFMKRFGKKIAKLRASYDFPATLTGSVKHRPEWIKMVLEGASLVCEDHEDARTFAQFYLAKDPAFSNTDTGMAAILFEVKLVAFTGGLYGVFMETIVHGNQPTFLALFEGKLRKEELERFANDVSEFCTFELMVRAGQANYLEGGVADLTILECSAVPGAKSYKLAPDTKGTAQQFQTDGKMPGGKSSAEYRMLPRTYESYANVIDEGGVTDAAFRVLYAHAQHESNGHDIGRAVDHNNVPWLCHEGVWVPDLETIQEQDTLADYEGADDEVVEQAVFQHLNQRVDEGSITSPVALRIHTAMVERAMADPDFLQLIQEGLVQEAAKKVAGRPVQKATAKVVRLRNASTPEKRLNMTCEKCVYYDPENKGLCTILEQTVKPKQVCDAYARTAVALKPKKTVVGAVSTPLGTLAIVTNKEGQRYSAVVKESLDENEKAIAKKQKAKGHKVVLVLPKKEGEPLYFKTAGQASKISREEYPNAKIMPIDKFIKSLSEASSSSQDDYILVDGGGIVIKYIMPMKINPEEVAVENARLKARGLNGKWVHYTQVPRGSDRVTQARQWYKSPLPEGSSSQADDYVLVDGKGRIIPTIMPMKIQPEDVSKENKRLKERGIKGKWVNYTKVKRGAASIKESSGSMEDDYILVNAAGKPVASQSPQKLAPEEAKAMTKARKDGHRYVKALRSQLEDLDEARYHADQIKSLGKPKDKFDVYKLKVTMGAKSTKWMNVTSAALSKIGKVLAALPESLEEGDTDKELKAGLQQWVDDYKKTRKTGNVKLAKQIKANIDKVVKKKKLDRARVYGTSESLDEATKRLWMRVGDMGDYEEFGIDMGSAAETLRELEVEEVDRWRKGGFESGSLRGNNYVSLYWGDKEGNLTKDLTKRERKKFEKALSEDLDESSSSQADDYVLVDGQGKVVKNFSPQKLTPEEVFERNRLLLGGQKYVLALRSRLQGAPRVSSTPPAKQKLMGEGTGLRRRPFPVNEATLYDKTEEGIASKFTAWCVRKEGTDDGKTLVSIGADHWVVEKPLYEVHAAIQKIAEFYGDLPEEFDVMVEAFLREFCAGEGKVAESVDAVSIGLFESTDEGDRYRLKVERDARVASNSKLRLLALEGVDETEVLLDGLTENFLDGFSLEEALDDVDLKRWRKAMTRWERTTGLGETSTPVHKRIADWFKGTDLNDKKEYTLALKMLQRGSFGSQSKGTAQRIISALKKGGGAKQIDRIIRTTESLDESAKELKGIAQAVKKAYSGKQEVLTDVGDEGGIEIPSANRAVQSAVTGILTKRGWKISKRDVQNRPSKLTKGGMVATVDRSGVSIKESLDEATPDKATLKTALMRALSNMTKAMKKKGVIAPIGKKVKFDYAKKRLVGADGKYSLQWRPDGISLTRLDEQKATGSATLDGKTIKTTEPTHLKALASKAGVSLKRAMRLWGKAQLRVLDQYPKIKKKSARYYQAATGIMKKMMKLPTKPLAASAEAAECFIIEQVVTPGSMVNLKAVVAAAKKKPKLSASEKALKKAWTDMVEKGVLKPGSRYGVGDLYQYEPIFWSGSQGTVQRTVGSSVDTASMLHEATRSTSLLRKAGINAKTGRHPVKMRRTRDLARGPQKSGGRRSRYGEQIDAELDEARAKHKYVKPEDAKKLKPYYKAVNRSLAGLEFEYHPAGRGKWEKRDKFVKDGVQVLFFDKDKKELGSTHTERKAVGKLPGKSVNVLDMIKTQKESIDESVDPADPASVKEVLTAVVQAEGRIDYNEFVQSFQGHKQASINGAIAELVDGGFMVRQSHTAHGDTSHDLVMTPQGFERSIKLNEDGYQHDMLKKVQANLSTTEKLDDEAELFWREVLGEGVSSPFDLDEAKPSEVLGREAKKAGIKPNALKVTTLRIIRHLSKNLGDLSAKAAEKYAKDAFKKAYPKSSSELLDLIARYSMKRAMPESLDEGDAVATIKKLMLHVPFSFKGGKEFKQAQRLMKGKETSKYVSALANLETLARGKDFASAYESSKSPAQIPLAKWKQLLASAKAALKEDLDEAASQVAKTIQKQIGRKAFKMMGAKQLLGDKKSLMWTVGKNSKGVTKVRVTLTPADEYNIEFIRIRKKGGVPEAKVLKTDRGIQVDNLHKSIENGTGMRLSL